ncbi:hypothetical protein HY988_04370 [Candidatus Micrarchaeota archaeon]|nr:hypothetical protein [Candidatus Micrarchaeota archaeon]
MFATKKTSGGRRIKRTRTKFIASVVLFSSLMLSTPKIANANSVELMVGNKSTTADLKASADLTKKVGIFVRARPTIDYRGKISAFGLGDLTLNLNGALDAVAEVQFVGGTIVPRAGIQYFRKAGDFSFYTITTIGFDSKPYLESLSSVRYSPRIYKTLNLIAQVENVTDLDRTGNNWSTQRIRLGLSKNNWGVGAAADLSETGNHPILANGTFGWNVGGFVSKTF